MKKSAPLETLCRISTVAVPFVKTVEPGANFFTFCRPVGALHPPLPQPHTEQSSHPGRAEGPYSARADNGTKRTPANTGESVEIGRAHV